MIASVVEKVRRDSPGGGFVKQDTTNGLWYEIGDDKARDKVGHAIRRFLDYKPQSKEVGVSNRSMARSTSTSSKQQATTAHLSSLPALDAFTFDSNVERNSLMESGFLRQDVTISQHNDNSNAKSGDQSLFAPRKAISNEKLDSIVVPSFVLRQTNETFGSMVESSEDAQTRTLSTKNVSATKEHIKLSASLAKSELPQAVHGSTEGTLFVASETNNFASFPHQNRVDVLSSSRSDEKEQGDPQLSSLFAALPSASTTHSTGRSSLSGGLSSEFHLPRMSFHSLQGQQSQWLAGSLSSLQAQQGDLFGRSAGGQIYSLNNGALHHVHEQSSAGVYHDLSSLGITGGLTGFPGQSQLSGLILPNQDTMMANMSIINGLGLDDSDTTQWSGTPMTMPGSSSNTLPSTFSSSYLRGRSTESAEQFVGGSFLHPSALAMSSSSRDDRGLENVMLNRDLHFQQQQQHHLLMQLLHYQQGGNSTHISSGMRLGDSSSMGFEGEEDGGEDPDDILRMLAGR